LKKHVRLRYVIKTYPVDGHRRSAVDTIDGRTFVYNDDAYPWS